jgi:DNA-directed RNA polymerase specialized sigma24 family protein
MGKKLRSMEESTDLCQSVLLAFHLRAEAGKLEMDDEAKIRAYLRGMLRNKLANRADILKAAKRGGGERPAPLEDSGGRPIDVPAYDPTASVLASVAEMKLRLERHLDRDEMAILEGRLAGRTNAEIAAELGTTADAVRMKWNRARERLVRAGEIADEPPRPTG